MQTIWYPFERDPTQPTRTHTHTNTLTCMKPAGKQRQHNSPDSEVHGANMGPTWGRQNPGGPHVGHMDLAIWECTRFQVLPTKQILIQKLHFRHFHSVENIWTLPLQKFYQCQSPCADWIRCIIEGANYPVHKWWDLTGSNTLFTAIVFVVIHSDKTCKIIMQSIALIRQPSIRWYWWYYEMETLSALLVLCEGIHQLIVDFLHKGTGVPIFNVFFYISLNKLLEEKANCWWFDQMLM